MLHNNVGARLKQRLALEFARVHGRRCDTGSVSQLTGNVLDNHSDGRPQSQASRDSTRHHTTTHNKAVRAKMVNRPNHDMPCAISTTLISSNHPYPARSTRWNLDLRIEVLPAVRASMEMVNTQCDRDDASFMGVSLIARLVSPCCVVEMYPRYQPTHPHTHATPTHTHSLCWAHDVRPKQTNNKTHQKQQVQSLFL